MQVCAAVTNIWKDDTLRLGTQNNTHLGVAHHMQQQFYGPDLETSWKFTKGGLLHSKGSISLMTVS